jgi:CubicO group peptidase (beta-lactamase class C family)
MRVSILTSLFLLGCYFNTTAQNPNPNASLDAFIQGEMTSEKFPGVSAIIVKGGEIIWVESYGYADVENSVLVQDTTVFLLASLSKVFTGTAAMQASESGIIDLDTDISTYLTWPLDIPGFENEAVTMRQLMTHSASINDGAAMDLYYDYPDPTISLGDCIQRYFSLSGADYDPIDNFISAAPGTNYSYSNMGTALNGFVTESATGMPFDDFCEDNIFDPLCMEKTAWHFADFDSSHVARPYSYQGGNYVPYPHYGFADYPDGQLRSNAMDLGNFMIAYLNGGTLGANSILTQASINEMWSPQIPSLEATQGLNWYQEELFHSGGSTMLWGHNGGEDGVSTDMYLDPVTNIGICILTNGEGDALSICDELYDYALNSIPTSSIIPNCLGTNTIEEALLEDREIVKVLDFMGRETTFKPNTPLIILYSDGSTERVFQITEQ